LAGAASCSTLPKAKTEAEAPLVEVVTETKFLPGRVVIQPYPVPDSGLVADPPDLTTRHITGDDIGTEAVMATALEWAQSFHDVKDQYNTLRGWVAGVAAGSAAAQKAIDAQPHNSTENAK